MLPIIPAMMLVTIVMTLILVTDQDRRDLDIAGTVSKDLVQVHEWRVNRARMSGIDNGEITGYPGYPFEPFFEYQTHAFRSSGLNVVMTWPDNFDEVFDPDLAYEFDLLKRLSGVPNRRVYAGLFIPNDDGGGRIANIDIPDIGRNIPTDVPVILNVYLEPTL